MHQRSSQSCLRAVRLHEPIPDLSGDVGDSSRAVGNEDGRSLTFRSNVLHRVKVLSEHDHIQDLLRTGARDLKQGSKWQKEGRRWAQ